MERPKRERKKPPLDPSPHRGAPYPPGSLLDENPGSTLSGNQHGRAREIITLSGGETFIAALSLALGLSDIVEMTNGAISLDTIFIDEGFGSLDTENDAGTLDQVLQVLQNIVGERRAVGLISHVPLVQQAVPNGFTVRKGVNGSQIEVRLH
ncbi:hypothetical protein OLX02_19760 [Novosphingobium sp. KCTC 2891]|uniref:SbcC/MukB-like Walker B domain-containing protein n=1 Tax=Novosphingobium sp. KCTC 2891 TaxID=2989730 RepID=UPI00222249DB|nr:SbcC/MukB-like Walker B domain-containing protein [Novosphingobium sp. KCTC 2891]MCW1385057.1 hypothetical protein [Novosphingobium sp. KCTC 2891]